MIIIPSCTRHALLFRFVSPPHTVRYVRQAQMMMKMLRLPHPPAVSALRCCLDLCNVESPTNRSIWCLLRVSSPRHKIPLCAAAKENEIISIFSM